MAGDKIVLEMHLKQPGFTYTACGPFTKNKERTQKIKETGYTNYVCKNELDKACFQHDMTYGDFKNLARRTASDKVLRHKSFNMAKNPKYDGYQMGLISLVYKIFDKTSADSGINMRTNNKIKQNQHPLDLAKHQLAGELHKTIIKKIKKRTVYSGFKDNIWGAVLAHMQLINKFNKWFRSLLCVIDIFSKYTWAVPLKDRKGITIAHAFQKILKESNRKPNKIWVDKGSEFCNRFVKKWLILKCLWYITKENLLLLKDLSEL